MTSVQRQTQPVMQSDANTFSVWNAGCLFHQAKPLFVGSLRLNHFLYVCSVQTTGYMSAEPKPLLVASLSAEPKPLVAASLVCSV